MPKVIIMGIPGVETLEDLIDATKGKKTRPICVIARDISTHWRKVNYAARPYLDAMTELDTIDDSYGCDSARSIIAYFLCNATSFRGEHARRIKKELKAL